MAKKVLQVTAVFLACLAFCCGGLMLWIRSHTTYYIAAYRIASLVDAGSNDALRARGYPVDIDCCRLSFEWNTYDNQDMDAGPYKLIVVVIPKTDELKSVTIRSMQIHSSKGNSYALGDGPIISIAVGDEEKRSSGKTRRSFPFDFVGDEEITTTLQIEFELGDQIEKREITLLWKPVWVRQWQSFV